MDSKPPGGASLSEAPLGPVRKTKRKSKGEPRFDPKVSKVKALRWKKKCSEKWPAYFKEHPPGQLAPASEALAAGTTGSAAA